MGAMRILKLLGTGLFVFFLLAILYKNSQQVPYLHDWDERFHALVAKNLVDDPSIPRLYKDAAAIHYNYEEWYRTLVWLHKPPLFSYQAALVMKLFGTNLFGYRLNGFITIALLIFTSFKLLRLYHLQFWPALIISSGTFFGLAFLKLSNGVMGMGQNDLSFILWISVGVLFAEKARVQGEAQRPKNIFLMALFCAFAVLTKFLVGYLPFLLLGLNAILYKWKLKDWLLIFFAALLPAAAIGSWYAYTYQIAPELTLKELEYNTRHFSESLESHSQDWLFHFEWFSRSFLVPILFILSLLVLSFWKKERRSQVLKALSLAFWAPLLASLFVLLFFTIAKTKLPAFSLVSAPLLIVMSGLLYGNREVSIYFKKWLLIVPLIGLAWGSIYVFQADYTDPKRNCQREFYRELGESLPHNAVLFNVEPFTFPEAMFYSGLICYEKVPSENWPEEAKAQGYIPYLLLRGGESTALKEQFAGRQIEYTCGE